MARWWWVRLGAIIVAVGVGSGAAQGDDIPVGVAKIDITPTHAVLLAGYGGRRGESEGIDTKLWARALAVGKDAPLVLVAVDNCGVPAGVVEKVAARLRDREGVPREHLVIGSTHTHNAPTLDGYAAIVWAGRTTDEQEGRVRRYTEWLTDKLVEAARAALAARKPARLAWGRGRVDFGGNRRVLEKGAWRGFGFQRDGPVDHSLPVLAAFGADKKPFAIWTNYACHCTTVGSRNRIGGDWAGAAAEAIEKLYPGAVALTTIGCGADVGPQPTGSLALAEQHGKRFAEEVARVLAGAMRHLTAQPTARMRRLQLPYAELPSREYWEKQAKVDGFPGRHARHMLATLDRDGKLPTHLDYPMATWRFGDELAVVFLAGEVVVDYAVRLDLELDWRRVWYTAWSNDVPCYIPSRRVLREGGYEADFSMIYYARPTRFHADVEDVLVDGVKVMVGDGYRRKKGQGLAPYHRPAAPAEVLRDRLQQWSRSVQAGEPSEVLRHLRAVAPTARPGFAKVLRNDGGEDRWFDFSGGKRLRPYLRQTGKDATLAWETAPLRGKESAENVTFVFLGGTGWKSQPETAGFVLLLDGNEEVAFDVTRQPRLWRNTRGDITLAYVQTWTSEEDSAGVFHVTLPAARATDGQPVRLGVRSRGTGSQRWFSLDPVADDGTLEAIRAGILPEPKRDH